MVVVNNTSMYSSLNKSLLFSNQYPCVRVECLQDFFFCSLCKVNAGPDSAEGSTGAKCLLWPILLVDFVSKALCN